MDGTALLAASFRRELQVPVRRVASLQHQLEDSMTDYEPRDMEQAPPSPAEIPPTDDTPAPRRMLLIQAHPDDAEFMCAGTVAEWVQDGAEVHYCSITSGDKGTSDLGVSSSELATLRECEQRAACEVLGVTSVIFLGYQDATLVPDLALRRELTRVIRRVKPDVLMCQDPTMRYSGQRYINHPDHIAAGEASLAAVFPSARDHKTFPELLDEGLEAHITPEVYIYGANQADVWVDISSSIDTKIAALKAHESQVGDRADELDEMIREWGRETARLHPHKPEDFGEYAESFKYMKLG
ncbi:MAG TPA: PIG-L deacetylase family protein [Thermomicrobiales bacterium]|nr:PIG-L deacetylase family protein [Thermomicrobiales bacterium]